MHLLIELPSFIRFSSSTILFLKALFIVGTFLLSPFSLHSSPNQSSSSCDLPNLKIFSDVSRAAFVQCSQMSLMPASLLSSLFQKSDIMYNIAGHTLEENTSALR